MVSLLFAFVYTFVYPSPVKNSQVIDFISGKLKSLVIPVRLQVPVSIPLLKRSDISLADNAYNTLYRHTECAHFCVPLTLNALNAYAFKISNLIINQHQSSHRMKGFVRHFCTFEGAYDINHSTN